MGNPKLDCGVSFREYFLPNFAELGGAKIPPVFCTPVLSHPITKPPRWF
jgi:hypothetical protein